jgi:hypothetical protein
MRKFGLFAAALLSMAAPAAAQSGDETILVRTARAIGDATAGQRVGNGAAADKVVYLGRNGQGTIVVTSIAALVPGGDASAPPAGAIAMVVTRASSANGNQTPIPADVALARSAGLPIFIVGEWATPPVLWELLRQGDAVRVRDVDAAGHAGPWRAATP